MLRTNRNFIIISVFSFLFFFLACKKEAVHDPAQDTSVSVYLNLPDIPYNYANPALPAYLTAPPIQGQINTPANNPITNDGATLGRVLFYDKNLSINNTISCSSCHKQAESFADNSIQSLGFAGGHTNRNSMSLIDAKYYPNGRFFWDQRAATLEDQVLTPIQDNVEMA